MKPNLISQWGWLMEIYNTDESEILGGILNVDSTIEQLTQAIEKAPDFWEEHLQGNDAPSQSMFLNFMEENPQFIAEVYLVEPARSDYRLEIVGVKAPNNKANTSILYDWVNHLEDGPEYGAEYSGPQEYGIYDGYIRAWWD